MKAEKKIETSETDEIKYILTPNEIILQNHSKAISENSSFLFLWPHTLLWFEF